MHLILRSATGKLRSGKIQVSDELNEESGLMTQAHKYRSASQMCRLCHCNGELLDGQEVCCHYHKLSLTS